MRNAPGKERGYVILPVVIPAGMAPSEALNDNKTYKVVWEVLQALRSHDDRFDALINKLDFDGKDPRKMEVICISDSLPNKPSESSKEQPLGKDGKPLPKKKHDTSGHSIGETPEGENGPKQSTFQFNVGELERALYARVVKKCGNRNYWDEWAKDIAQIAKTHISRITTIVGNPDNKKEAKAFNDFLAFRYPR